RRRRSPRAWQPRSWRHCIARRTKACDVAIAGLGFREGAAESALGGLVGFSQLLARGRAHELGAAEQLASLERGAGAVLAAQEARHGGRGECTGGTERRAGRFGAVAQTIRIDGRL